MSGRRVARLLAVLCVALGLGGGAAAQVADSERVLVGRIEGVINPVTARYVDRLITDGEQRGVRAVVLSVDTPGGTLDATTKITQRMLGSKVPVVVWVSPSGARAASAGTFITLAAHVALMAPATNIGAAHPVASSGEDIQGDMRAKAENDAAAQIRNIAQARSRNADWAEEAVRKSVSVTAEEAVSLRVVDGIAADLGEVLRRVNGRDVEEHPFSPLERVLHAITDPTVAILLFTIGTYGLIFELSNPSLIFPGVVGVIAILLALFAFGTLDANAAGLALLVFAVLLFVAEAWVPSHGILTAGGVAAMVIGALILFPPGRPTLPGVQLAIPPLTIALVAGSSALFFIVLARASYRYLRLPTASGASIVVGSVGVAKTDMAPSGIVHVAGEDWSATSDSGPLREGEAISVTRIDGVKLIVARTTER
ncbi:MAG: nodulation protein NfeD [Chloroflexi bacterium]|nr:nodulation protein NfeD [Chloroflexota bacterium]